MHCEHIKAFDSIKSTPIPLESINSNNMLQSLSNIVLTCLSSFNVYVFNISLEWQAYSEVIELCALQSAYTPSQFQLASRGRPRFDISKDQLEYLSSMSFMWTQIASMFDVSRMTIYHCRVEFGMSHDGMSSNITDEELVVILRQMRRENPALGERMVMGHLRSMGFKITRSRVRDCI